MKLDTCGSPQAGFLFTAPTQLLWRHQAAVLSNTSMDPLPTLTVGNWKWDPLWAPVHLNWSDQKRKTRWFCLLPLPCSKQFNRNKSHWLKNTQSTRQALAGASFTGQDVITKTVITKSWDPGSVTLVGENARRGSCCLCCEYSKTANGSFNF